MAKSLLIVESPTKVNTLKKIVGKDFIIKASVGHLKDLPKKKLGVDVDNNFAPEYITIRGKGKILQELKTAAKKVDKIFLAPDPDREGEAIAYHIGNEVARFTKGKIYRVLFNEITKKAVLEAINNPTELNTNRVNAQQARRILDRLVGYKISPILWKKVHRGLSAGRVQSVALRIVCEREREILDFKPREYWSITLELEGSQKPQFQAKLFKIDGNKAEVANKSEADEILENLQGANPLLESIVKKERKRNPSAPFITSTLQQEASRKLNFSPKKTMMLAQRLYEGIALGKKGTVGLITYMRTDSVKLSDQALDEVRTFIPEKYGKEYLPAKPNFYKSKKSAQEAHEAIRPTDVQLEPNAIKEHLEKDSFRLYQLIWSRFVSCQMVPAVLDTTQFDITTGKYLFRSNGSILKFAGFMKVYVESNDDEQAEGAKPSAKGDDRLLPPLEKGETLKLQEILPEQHFTQPPARFSEAMLVKELEDKGVGRPSTYAAIISVIKDRDYIQNIERRLQPVELGFMINDLLVENFPDIISTEFTAKMEEQLDDIEGGRLEWTEALNTFYTPFKADLEKAEEKMKDFKAQVEETDAVCEKCEKPMIIKWGRFGKFMACSGYPECKNTKDLGDKGDSEDGGKSDEVEGNCDLCESALIMKRGRFGKFIACSNYPDCKFTKPIGLGIACPEEACEGEIAPRRSKKGRTFYGCTKYPDCKFTSWDKPVAEACPECKNPFMVEKWKKNEDPSILCPNCGFTKTNAAA
ncbi:MAG: type I DNA topoisomerase [Nitrospinaceae bacterium]|nr:type I DNA topoisomerase [Nitrospina sp.]MBT5377320.1 type I DNA topoisomerase [Nitrospinaceae bacterium]MBT5867650.1 type I DNA topoisomerase [Nitrospinaceae bacterium]MBT6347403.1 type I DNA topoisomerase [Nitrospina sp.]